MFSIGSYHLGNPILNKEGSGHICFTAPAGTHLAIRKEIFYTLNSPFCCYVLLQTVSKTQYLDSKFRKASLQPCLH